VPLRRRPVSRGRCRRLRPACDSAPSRALPRRSAIPRSFTHGLRLGIADPLSSAASVSHAVR